jgi:hypothetical protein
MKRARIQLLVGVLIAVILAGLGIAGLVRERELAARTRCRDNMRQIGLSLDCYYDACGGVYPSGTVTIKLKDTNGVKTYRLSNALVGLLSFTHTWINPRYTLLTI